MTQALNLANFANNLNTAGATSNGGLQNSSVTVTAGTGMSGGGSVALGSSVTLNNAGVTSVTAGTGISVSATTGALTVTNTGTVPTLTTTTLNSTSGVLATQNGMTGIAKAWVNFVGSSGATNASFNVSSVTRVGAGQYTINFTTAMPNIYYVTTTAASNNSTSGVQTGAFCWGTQTTTTTNIATTNGAANIQDPAVAYVAVFSS